MYHESIDFNDYTKGGHLLKEKFLKCLLFDLLTDAEKKAIKGTSIARNVRMQDITLGELVELSTILTPEAYPILRSRFESFENAKK
jgi:hypothetical protein